MIVLDCRAGFCRCRHLSSNSLINKLRSSSKPLSLQQFWSKGHRHIKMSRFEPVLALCQLHESIQIIICSHDILAIEVCRKMLDIMLWRSHAIIRFSKRCKPSRQST